MTRQREKTKHRGRPVMVYFTDEEYVRLERACTVIAPNGGTATVNRAPWIKAVVMRELERYDEKPSKGG